ncbi:MAG: GNAT family N-acetyltransferase [Nocardioidaceae bacterium]
MPLHAGLVGQRIVVRHLLPGEQGPTGGPAMSDVLGILETWDETSISVRREGGELVTISREHIVTGKPVPPRASTRLRINPEQLERECQRGWRAVNERELGDWTLRAAGGFTGRANSVRVGGDPGLPLVDAVDEVTRFYGGHGLRPMAQVVVGSGGQRDFESLGWQPRQTGPDPIVQVASVAQARRQVSARSRPAAVTIDDSVGADWLGHYERAAGLDTAVVTQVLQSGDDVAFARVGDPVVAIGRGVVSGDWLGLQAVEVAPSHRRQGLATAVVEALLEWGASRGALSAYLQTLPDNVGALRLYSGFGFATHHSYRYLVPPTAQ